MARQLLTEGKAAVWRRSPCTIILKRSVSEAEPAPVCVKIEPGGAVTSLALVSEGPGRVRLAGELAQRGRQVKARLDQRLHVVGAGDCAIRAIARHTATAPIAAAPNAGCRPPTH